MRCKHGQERMHKRRRFTCAFDAWITSRDRDYMERHLIPDRLDLASAQMLPEFVREREKAIRQRLMRYAAMVPA